MQETGIDWNAYASLQNDDTELEERHAKNEGSFAIVSVGPVGNDDFYKIHIGLKDGRILRSPDELTVEKNELDDSDLSKLVSVVGSPF